MNYRIRYPGSQPRGKSASASTTLQTHHNWMRGGTKLAGLHIAGQCIICLLIFGFGLSVIGALSLVMSASTEVTDRRQSTPPAIVGCVLLSAGASFLFVGLIFFCCAARRAKMRLLREESGRPTVPAVYEAPYLAGTDAPVSPDDPSAPGDPAAVYYISENPDATPYQNSGYVTDKSDERFKGFTYNDAGNESVAPDGEQQQWGVESLPRPLPNRLPPITRETIGIGTETGYSTPATYGRTE